MPLTNTRNTDKAMEDQEVLVSPQNIYEMIRGQVHPVVLSYDCEHIPFHGVGTAFILEHRNELFLISAQHILDSQRADANDIRIVYGEPPLSITFDRKAVFNPEMEPHFDLVIMRIASFQRDVMAELGFFWIGTEYGLGREGFPIASDFLVAGYPDEGRAYDYENRIVSAELAVLIGKHITPIVSNLNTLAIHEPRLLSFRGLSGSLVIAELDGEWRFAGMATMGSETSSLINFIPASVIVHYLDRTCELEEAGELLNE